MRTTQLRQSQRSRPFVAVFCDVPLLGEAMRSALEFADVQTFAARGGDLDGLLRSLRPDALIVDTEAGAEAAAAFAGEHDLPVVHIGVHARAMRLYRAGAWELVAGSEPPTPEAIRNVVAGALFARRDVAR